MSARYKTQDLDFSLQQLHMHRRQAHRDGPSPLCTYAVYVYEPECFENALCTSSATSSTLCELYAKELQRFVSRMLLCLSFFFRRKETPLHCIFRNGDGSSSHCMHTVRTRKSRMRWLRQCLCLPTLSKLTLYSNLHHALNVHSGRLWVSLVCMKRIVVYVTCISKRTTCQNVTRKHKERTKNKK